MVFFFPLTTGFRYVQFQFKTGLLYNQNYKIQRSKFIVCRSVCLCLPCRIIRAFTLTTAPTSSSSSSSSSSCSIYSSCSCSFFFIQGVSNYAAYLTQIMSLDQNTLLNLLLLQYTVHVMLFPTLNVFCLYICTWRRACAVPNMAVVSSSVISCTPGMILRWFHLPLLLLACLPRLYHFHCHLYAGCVQLCSHT